MKQFLKAMIRKITDFFAGIFTPVMGTDASGEIVLVESPEQVIARKATALALGVIAISLLTTPPFLNEGLAIFIGDKLARIATQLWNYTGTLA